jgi:two-component system sensor histidine kinase RegB
MHTQRRPTESRLIHLRWLTVVAMTAAALISPGIVGTFRLAGQLLVLSASIAAINTYLRLAGSGPSGDADASPLLSPVAQLNFDLLCWSLFCFLSGGATNPLITVFLPLIAIGALVLDRLQAWLLGALAMVLYLYLWHFHVPLDIPDAHLATRLHIFGMWLVFVVSDILVIWFIQQMRKSLRDRDAQLAESREQAIRNDWLVSLGGQAAAAAHALSTPLATMSILVDEHLEDPSISPPLRADLLLMRRQIESCKVSLGQLTQRADFARGTASRRLDAGEWLGQLLEAWRLLNPAACLEVNMPPLTGAHGLIVDLALERAIDNFLDNAKHAGASKIALDVRTSAAQLIITISDNGAGFSPVARQSFDAKQPVHSDNGMGVGLLLSRAAIERCGGVLAIAPLAGGGSQVQITLPLIGGNE